MLKRPERTTFFEQIAERLQEISAIRVLELGSGPGFLARHLRDSIPGLQLTLLDFSPAMHELARARLGAGALGVDFVTRSFRDDDWTAGLPRFDAVVTMQAVHELRHKRHAVALHAAVKAVLRSGGEYLVCDHFAGEGGIQHTELYMTAEEQALAVCSASFLEVERVIQLGTLVLHRARSASDRDARVFTDEDRELEAAGLTEYAASLPDEDCAAMIEPDAFEAVRWVPGKGWVEP